MSHITIPASEIRTGDRFDIAGLTCVTAGVSLGIAECTVGFTVGGIYNTCILPNGAEVLVTRDDPDAKLIERVAIAMCNADGEVWDDYVDQDAYTRIARAAVAAFREAVAA